MCVVFNTVYYRKQYRMGNLKNVFLTMLTCNGIYIITMLVSWLVEKVSLHGMNWVRVVGFLPIFFFFLAKVSKSEYKNTLDFMTPSNSIGNMCAHVGCIFGGCCHGFPIENYPEWLRWMGIYNNETGSYLFPIQLVECFLYGAIAFGIVFWARSKHFKTNGKSFPLYLILFGSLRFCCEFGRDNVKIAGGLSEFSFWCIAWFVLGVTWLGLIHINERKKRLAAQAAAKDTAVNDIPPQDNEQTAGTENGEEYAEGGLVTAENGIALQNCDIAASIDDTASQEVNLVSADNEQTAGTAE